MAELDKDYPGFHEKWKLRLGLKDIHIAEAYMRGEAHAAIACGTIPHDPSKSGIHVRVEGRGVDCLVDPSALVGMAAEWREVLDDNSITEADQRKFTKDYIAQVVALNKHLEADGDLIFCATVWLYTENKAGMAALRQPGNGVLCEFVFDDQTRTRKMRLKMLLR